MMKKKVVFSIKKMFKEKNGLSFEFKLVQESILKQLAQPI